MINNIIFDMGNVLLRFDRDVFLDVAGVSDSDRKLLMQEVFLSVEWAMMDRGTLDEEPAYERICSRLPERLHKAARELVMSWDKHILPVPGMAELVRELKENGYSVYLLSNASRRQHEYWPRVPGSEYFDGTVVSADLKIIKPQPEIYLYTLERFGLNAGECVFIDDSPVNIESAEFCGIAGIVFRGDAGNLRGELKSLGVNISG